MTSKTCTAGSDVSPAYTSTVIILFQTLVALESCFTIVQNGFACFVDLSVCPKAFSGKLSPSLVPWTDFTHAVQSAMFLCNGCPLFNMQV